MLENVTMIAEPPVMAVPSGRLDIICSDGKNTRAPGAASVAHMTDAKSASHAAAITLVIENMFQRRIRSFQCTNDGVQVFQLDVYQPA